MSTNKKRRAENFTQKEEQLLLRLVKLKAKEIESKKTDANNLKIKCDAWAQVTTMFNCHSGESHRDTDTLRNKYNNIKKRAKVKFSEEKKYMYGTGGGPAMKNADDDVMNEIQEIVGAQITGMESKYDDDSLVCENTDPNKPTEVNALNEKITVVKCVPPNVVNQTVSELDSVEFVFESSNQHDWGNYNPDMLKTPISKELQTATLEKQGTSGACTKKPDPLKTKLGKWADKKKDLADLQRKCFLEEHKLKLQHLAEKHQQYIALQEKESEQRLKLEKEKHDLEMKILRHQNSNIV